jgi:hypothetical protein
VDIIGERTVDFVDAATGQKSPVRLCVGRPVHNGENWVAPVAIYGPAAETWEADSHGGTSLQALFHAFSLLSMMAPRRFKGRGELTFDDDPWDVGLGQVVLPGAPPVP